MFQWASERKWHLQSFLFLGRERIIALHCFKAYQVSKAFHSFLGSRYYAGDDARLCRRRSLYWRYLSNLWSLYLDLTNSYWFSSSILVLLVAWLLPEKIEQLLWYLEIPIKSVCTPDFTQKTINNNRLRCFLKMDGKEKKTRHEKVKREGSNGEEKEMP